jgi:4-hydroxybenzoate polyprenyltransferase
MSSASVSTSPSARLRTYASFVRFEHTLFSLPLLLAGIFSVPGRAMPVARWLLIALAAVGARTAAMAMNRLIDLRLDALNPRTQVRELPSGRMKVPEAIALLVVSAGVYLTACAALGPWYLFVAPIPLAVFAVYPYLKRFTPLCHFGVGAALALAPLAGYAAAHPDLGRLGPALALAVFALAWVSGFDVIYATLDEDFDRAHGVRSMVVAIGRDRALQLSGALHLAAFASLGLTVAVMTRGGGLVPWGWPVAAGLLAVAGLLLFLEQRWAENVNLAFFKVNVWVGVVVLVIVLAVRAATPQVILV